MRNTLLRLALCLAIAHCGPTPIYPTGSTGGAGTCPEMAVQCGRAIDDICADPLVNGLPRGASNVGACISGSPCQMIPPPCWHCPAGRRIWRSDELAAWVASGVCPAGGEGVPRPQY